MNEVIKKKPIVSFNDLEVYRNTYEASIAVMTKIITKLPDNEKYDLKDQLSRSCKSIPRLIAEGYAKKHQKQGFQKYLDDAMGECNEMVVSLSHCRDLYSQYIEKEFCIKLIHSATKPDACQSGYTNVLIDIYDKSGRQLYNLAEAWNKFKNKEKRTT